ncbi:MAG: NAD-dependent epimerase/dehydratase family protein [Christensenellaceae bacterium]
MKLAIIGANSYLARNFIFWLRQNTEANLALYDLAETHRDGEEGYRQIDVSSPEGFAPVAFDADLLYYFIGKTGTAAGFEDYETFLDANERALLHFLTAYRKADSKAKIVYPSTRLVYRGKTGKLKEDDEKETRTVYAVNKLAAEGYLRAWANAFGVRYVTLRLCVPYGTLIPQASSYGTAEFMLSLAREGKDIPLYGGGRQRRTLTYVGDFCRILAECASPSIENDVYNVGGEEYSLAQMAELIGGKCGVRTVRVPFPPLAEAIESGDTVFDDEKWNARSSIRPTMTFAEWVKKAFEH